MGKKRKFPKSKKCLQTLPSILDSKFLKIAREFIIENREFLEEIGRLGTPPSRRKHEAKKGQFRLEPETKIRGIFPRLFGD